MKRLLLAVLLFTSSAYSRGFDMFGLSASSSSHRLSVLPYPAVAIPIAYDSVVGVRAGAEGGIGAIAWFPGASLPMAADVRGGIEVTGEGFNQYGKVSLGIMPGCNFYHKFGMSSMRDDISKENVQGNISETGVRVWLINVGTVRYSNTSDDRYNQGVSIGLNLGF